MFNPHMWNPEFNNILLSQKAIWGSLFGGKLVVEKVKTPGDGNPRIGKRYRTIIERLKSNGLMVELKNRLPNIYQDYYFYKKGNEVYWRCASRLGAK